MNVTEGMIWTRAKAEQELRKEVRRHTVDIDELVKVPLTQNQYDALASFHYNTGGLGKSTLLKKLNKGDFAGAAAEFHKWNKAGGKVRAGLVTRRAQEAELFLTPDASAEPVMPQAVDVPAPVKDAANGRDDRPLSTSRPSRSTSRPDSTPPGGSARPSKPRGCCSPRTPRPRPATRTRSRPRTRRAGT